MKAHTRGTPSSRPAGFGSGAAGRLGILVAASLLLPLSAGGFSAASATPAKKAKSSACGKGAVALVINGSKTLCVARSGFFRRSTGDKAEDALVGTFVGADIWKRLAGNQTVAAALGGDATDAARWERGVYQAAKAALRKQTGGRELLSRKGTGAFSLPGFADSVPAPSRFQQVKSTLDGLERERKKLLEDKEANATAAASGPPGTLEFVITPRWELDGCPDTFGRFLATKTLTLIKRFTSADGVVSIERVVITALLEGHLNDESLLEGFKLHVRAAASDSRGGEWTAEMTVSETKPAGEDDLLVPLMTQPFWAGSESSDVNISLALKGKLVAATNESVKAYLNDVLKQATEQARKDAERNFAAAFQTYYTAHRCNKIRYSPATVKLKPGETKTIEVDMHNVSRRKGDPKWKAKKVTGKGIEVISVKPKGKSKVKIITIRASKRTLQSAAGKASLTVDGVSIRGRGLDSLPITIGEEPIAYVGTASGSYTTVAACCQEKQSWTAEGLRFDREPGDPTRYILTKGVVNWSYTASIISCTVSGNANLSPLGPAAAARIAFTPDRSGYFLDGSYVQSGTVHEVCPGYEADGQMGAWPVWVDSNGQGTQATAPKPDESLSGSADADYGDGNTAHWQWSLTPVR